MTITTKHAIPLIYLTSFLFLFGETIQPAPRIAIYESIVCRQHYASSPGRHDCKVAPVQEELALLNGIERLSIIIPSILAIPFAALADRYGHSLILAIAIFGVFLEDGWPFLITWFPDVFPIRLIWLHFVFSCVGGGFTVIVTLLHVIIADVVSAEERTRMFFQSRAAGVAASIAGYACSGALMRVSDFLPWAVGLGTLVLATITAAMIPNTTVEAGNKPADEEVMSKGWAERFRSTGEALENVAKLLIGNRQVLAMLILVFMCQLGFDAGPLMLSIYVSKRYGWSFSNASFLSALEMSVELLMLVLILPLLTKFLPAAFQRLSPSTKDKYIAEWSLVALAVGQLCLGFAPVVAVAILGVVIVALGAGQDSLLRSLATEMVKPSEISTIYSAITMLRAIGGSSSGPIYAWLYSVGLGLKSEVWLGLPYVAAGLLFLVALGLLVCLKVTDREGYEPIGERQDEDGDA
ncbi:MFS general substrate transporter [Bimuria novae-zelandiae CBS 107.79]|uniref:MFS general substrate transporter n=1 Tax=Bimuria novae-zelandiae CBS 107.79 TaxID=1447943 RepID=A0A6A5V4P6_9PLEO|nr:MFS general substrate transporter [Bimuria novae-zelandiae CBS 107.79]